MSCDRYFEWMSAALDGELDGERRRELEAHVAVCPACAQTFQDLRAQSAALRELDCQVPQSLTRAVLEQLPPREKQGKVIHWRRWASLAACFVVAVVALGVGLPHAQSNRTGAPLASGDTTMDPGAPILSTQETGGQEALPKQYIANVGPQALSAIRVSYGATPAAPATLVLGDRESLLDYLAQFPMDDLSAVAAAYGEDYFRAGGQVLAVVLEAGSGSSRYAIVSATQETVQVQADIPPVGTADMAAWLLLAQVSGLTPGSAPALEYVD